MQQPRCKRHARGEAGEAAGDAAAMQQPHRTRRARGEAVSEAAAP
jgi:hypothetical protein